MVSVGHFFIQFILQKTVDPLFWNLFRPFLIKTQLPLTADNLNFIYCILNWFFGIITKFIKTPGILNEKGIWEVE